MVEIDVIGDLDGIVKGVICFIKNFKELLIVEYVVKIIIYFFYYKEGFLF